MYRHNKTQCTRIIIIIIVDLIFHKNDSFYYFFHLYAKCSTFHVEMRKCFSAKFSFDGRMVNYDNSITPFSILYLVSEVLNY